MVGSSRMTAPDPEVGVDVGNCKSVTFGNVGAVTVDGIFAIGVVVGGVSSIVTVPPPPLPNPEVGDETGLVVDLTGVPIPPPPFPNPEVGAGMGLVVDDAGFETGRALIGTATGAKIGGRLGFDVGEGPSTTPNDCSIRSRWECTDSLSTATATAAWTIHKRMKPKTRRCMAATFDGDCNRNILL